MTKYGFYNETQLYFCYGCKTKFRETTGTIFNRSIFRPQMFLTILTYFIENLTAKQIAGILRYNFSNNDYIISNSTIKKIFRLFRSLIHSFILKILNQIKFTGTIEVDEAHIYKKKDQRGRPYQFDYWVLGLKCRETKQCLIIPVKDRKHETLISILLGIIYIVD